MIFVKCDQNSRISRSIPKVSELMPLPAEFAPLDNPKHFPEWKKLYEGAHIGFKLMQAGILPTIPKDQVKEFKALGFKFHRSTWVTPELMKLYRKLQPNRCFFDNWFARYTLPEGWYIALDKDYAKLPIMLNDYYILDNNHRVRAAITIDNSDVLGYSAEMTLLPLFQVVNKVTTSSEDPTNYDVHYYVQGPDDEVVEEVGCVSNVPTTIVYAVHAISPECTEELNALHATAQDIADKKNHQAIWTK